MTNALITFLIWPWHVKIPSEDLSPVIQFHAVKKWYQMHGFISVFVKQVNSSSGTNSMNLIVWCLPGKMGKRGLGVQLCETFRQSSRTIASGFQKPSNRSKYKHLFKIRFVESSQGNKIVVTKYQDGCYAPTGYQGTPYQELNLDGNNMLMGTTPFYQILSWENWLNWRQGF